MRHSTKKPKSVRRSVAPSWSEMVAEWEIRLRKPIPNPPLYKEWESFTRTPFPPAAKGQVVDGVDLVLIHSKAADCIQIYVERGFSFESETYGVLEEWVYDLSRVVPMLVGDTAAYFERLLDFGRRILGEVPE
jgi:hypothetical protein